MTDEQKIIESQKRALDDLRRENIFLRARIEDEKAEKLAVIEELKNFLYGLPNCNSCKLKNVCRYAPKRGGSVRYNCFYWEEEKK